MTHDFIMEEIELARERKRVRTINGKKYTIRCSDPYGAWIVEGDDVPKELSGMFTGVENIWRAIESYENRRNSVTPVKKKDELALLLEEAGKASVGKKKKEG